MLSPLKHKKGPRRIILYWHVVRDAGLKMAELGYLAFLKTYSAGWGVFPSLETIMADTGLSAHTVKKYNRRLRQLGIMRTVARGRDGKRTSNAYLFDDESKAKILALNAATKAGKTRKLFRGQKVTLPNGAESDPQSSEGKVCPQSISEKNSDPLPASEEECQFRNADLEESIQQTPSH